LWEARLAAKVLRKEQTGKVTILYSKLKTKNIPLAEFAENAGRSKPKNPSNAKNKKNAFDFPAFSANPARDKDFDYS